MTPLPTALYHLLLRDGRTFQTGIDLIPHLTASGITHLYLSPIFQATTGSTHGYDVTDPTRIDDSLGGQEGFDALARAARAASIDIVLDIVPNHTAFNLENPWLVDVLTHGEDSRYALHFDIDWGKGRLVVPFLTAPAAQADLRVEDGKLTDGSIHMPLRPGTETMEYAHDAQAYRLTFWEYERDGITHRRFFNVTGLIGMRVEDDQVFADTHALIFDLVRSGKVQGLRVDHIDGLSDPKQYLDRMAEALPDTPIWVEKILTGDEALPADWKTLGTTGYESGRALARVLTDADGLARIDGAWRAATGIEGDFEDALAIAKDEVAQGDLAAELRQLVDLGQAALGPEAEAGPEWVREAVLALLRHFPRYRTYFSDTDARDEDRAVMQATADHAAADVRTDRVLRLLAHAITEGATPEARAFRMRFQQVTGALLAKSHEDTTAFRFNRYLAANEVGGLPDEATMTAEAFDDWLQTLGPGHVHLTSSHDTKRSEDARMRLVAMTHRPKRALALWKAAAKLPQARGIAPNTVWYVVQTVLAMWESDREDLADRLSTHLEKALREAKEITNWTHPDTKAEGAVIAFGRALCDVWAEDLPRSARAIMKRADQLSLAQVALKCALPGIPYIFQGTEVMVHTLTDPDNRLAVDYRAVSQADTDKARLTRAMLTLRKDHPDFFKNASAHATHNGNVLHLRRKSGGQVLDIAISLSGKPIPAGNIWPPKKDAPLSVNWEG
ncbi:malto-oligosyltrehalose synthase [Falsirhodobacter halotolerans]|uniref:malto-oligosyltrehalose synthase n=1 Tax=Falsirhodobacter halotolerans TaxID=1146892 RepID=UPI001FD07437|nr:malto-oligosyltrehalose synthase [Falsirhodobacter halotolerans]MCJ8140480.1 malto-oligosyltrehalose synthase [Falsirhodobacter halotolerans]